jgi:PAS domain-containing protein
LKKLARIFIFAFCLSTLTLSGQKSLQLNSNEDDIEVTETYLSTLLGKKDWNINDITANEDLFKPTINNNPLKKGTNNETVWLKLVLTEIKSPVLIQFNHTHLEKLKFYFFVDGKDSGIIKDVSLKCRININYKLKFPSVFVPRGKSVKCFIEFNPGGNSASSEIHLIKQEELFRIEAQKNVYYGFLFGVMALAVIIYLVVFSITRNSSNIFFALFIITFAIYIAVCSGIYYLYIPQWGKIFLSNKWAPAIWVNFSCAALCAFARRYLFGNVRLSSIYISPHIILSFLILLFLPFDALRQFHLASHINMIIGSLSIFYCFHFKSRFLYKPSKRIIYTGFLIFCSMVFVTVLGYEGLWHLPTKVNSRLLEIGGVLLSIFTALGYFILYLKEQSNINQQLIKEQERVIKLRSDENQYKKERIKNLLDKKEWALENLNGVLDEIAKIDEEIKDNENAILVSSKAQGKVSRQIAESAFISKDIINNLPTMVIIVDSNLIVIDYNEKFEKMNKLMGIEIHRGQSLIQQINPMYRSHYEKHYKLAFSKGQEITKPVFYKNAILTEGYWLNITYHVFSPSKDENTEYCIAFAQQIERKRHA